MSHFIVNINLVCEVINTPNLTDSQRDTILFNLYTSGKLKGGPDMMKRTIQWFIATYPTRFATFELFLRLQ